MPKNVVILGSTGSIGTQTLEVIESQEDIFLYGIVANKNIDLLFEQIKKYRPSKVVVSDRKNFEILCNICKDFDVEIFFGQNSIIDLVEDKKVDLVVNSLVGSVGLIPTIHAIKAKKDIAMANKESLVIAGNIIMELAKENNVNIIPVDSEHSAIFQCLQGNDTKEVNKFYLTASGGPFKDKKYEDLINIGPKEALNHPKWFMGDKITIDSATLMNKGFEVIEASVLFSTNVDDIQVLIHPQCIIHSMVEYKDGSIIAQLGETDMRVPIGFALNFPKRCNKMFSKMNFEICNSLTFEKPKEDIFGCLRLAYIAAKIGYEMPAILNAANEVCVKYFLDEKIGFFDIFEHIKKCMNAYTMRKSTNLEEILEADNWARNFIKELVG